MSRVLVRYFASLRDRAGVDAETVDAAGRDLGALYEQLRQRHSFVLGVDSLRVARNGAFSDWGVRPLDGDEIVFIPPVSGG